MMEKENTREEQDKKKWEAPSLISLDKGKTEGGSFSGHTESHSYAPGNDS